MIGNEFKTGRVTVMVKIYYRTIRSGTALRFVTSFTEAEIILKDLCEQHLPAITFDEDYPKEVIGRVWEDDNGHWNWFCK